MSEQTEQTEQTTTVSNLAQFKRYLATQPRVTLTRAEWLDHDTIEDVKVWRPMGHRFLHVTRTAFPRSGFFELTTGSGETSRMEYGKASEWTFEHKDGYLYALMTEREANANGTEYGTRLQFKCGKGDDTDNPYTA